MTLHSSVNYKCSYCGTSFVPMPVLSECPKCSLKSSVVFDNFIEDSVKSSLYNLETRGSFLPPAWGFITIGDRYYWFAFEFLSFVSSSAKIGEKELLNLDISENIAQKLTSKFLNTHDIGGIGLFANALESYLVSLLYSQKDGRIKNKTEVIEKLSDSRDIEGDPNKITYFNLGNAYFLNGDKSSALNEYEILKKLNINLANQLLDLINN